MELHQIKRRKLEVYNKPEITINNDESFFKEYEVLFNNDIKNIDGYCLNFCAENNCFEVFDYIENKMIIHYIKNNNKVLIWGIVSKNINFVKYIIEKCKITYKEITNDNNEVFRIASFYSTIEIVKYILYAYKLTFFDVYNVWGNLWGLYFLVIIDDNINKLISLENGKKILIEKNKEYLCQSNLLQILNM